MNRGVFHGSLQQPVVAGNASWPAANNLRPVNSEASSPLLLDLQTSNSFYPHSWSQLLLGGLLSEEQLMHYSQELNVKKDNMLDFTNNKTEIRQFTSDHFSERCNSIETGACVKKARLQGSSSSKFTTFKVRKEKLGDRITALHQMVSPFGKTDTASVLLEAVGYIRFLQSQIEALSSPYLNTIGGNTKPHAKGERNCIFPEDPTQDDDCETKKDLRSRGLCLVPVSYTLHVGTDEDAGFWAPSIVGAFR